MEAVEDSQDPLFGLKVDSLYGHTEESLAPGAELLGGLDLLLADLQDIGTRYYTYAATLVKLMQVADGTGTHVVVLDRPNPINGVDEEGGLVEEELASYVGELPVPQRHGLTMGELARLSQQRLDLDVELTVVRLRGWNRTRYFDELDLLWIPPSPNMPRVETALVYPGLCLLEGTNVSEGRGTTTPFELFGAPWVDPLRLAARIEEELPAGGFILVPCCFRPQFGKWAHQVCRGLRLVVRDRSAFRPLAFGLALVKWLYALHPDDFDWRRECYEFVRDRLAIDLLMGRRGLKERLERGDEVAGLCEDLRATAADFRQWSQTARLYADRHR